MVLRCSRFSKRPALISAKRKLNTVYVSLRNRIRIVKKLQNLRKTYPKNLNWKQPKISICIQPIEIMGNLSLDTLIKYLWLLIPQDTRLPPG